MKIWVCLEVEASELEIRVEDGEELYASYYGVDCSDIDYEKAWAYYEEGKYENQ